MKMKKVIYKYEITVLEDFRLILKVQIVLFQGWTINKLSLKCFIKYNSSGLSNHSM